MMNFVKRFHGSIYCLALVGMMFFLTDTAGAETLCVSSSAELQSALSTAGSNGEDDIIQVVQGTYLTPGSQFIYGSSENFNLDLLGGYAGGCASRILNPANTILDGQNANRVINLQPGITSGSLHFQGFTVRNGYITGAFNSGAGLNIGGLAGYSGNVTIDFNIFTNNNNTVYFGGGLSGGTDLGILRIENNLFVNNNANSNGGASLTANGPAIYITNNTIAGNTASIDDGGLRIGGSAPATISNNIFWGNTADDLILVLSNPLLENNDIQTQSGSAGPGSSGNVSVDPMFVGGVDYHIQAISPLINAGTNTPGGGLPATDLDGNPRISGGIVDIGAYEFQLTVPAVVPTLSEWGMVILSVLMAGYSIWFLKRVNAKYEDRGVGA